MRRAVAVLLQASMLCALTSSMARAHSASDAYLTLTADAPAAGRVSIHGQWDIALRDLDFVLKLDDDGDGRITWGEVSRHQSAIEHLAYSQLTLGDAGRACTLKPVRFLIDTHADGAYAALFFDAVCTPNPRRLSVKYGLFFTVDPSHRGIFVIHAGANTATAVLSPDHASLELPIS